MLCSVSWGGGKLWHSDDELFEKLESEIMEVFNTYDTDFGLNSSFVSEKITHRAPALISQTMSMSDKFIQVSNARYLPKQKARDLGVIK